MPDQSPPRLRPLSKTLLLTDQAAFALGKLAAQHLVDHGLVQFFMSSTGEVELVPLPEITADWLPEDEAVPALVAQGYSEEQLVEYLKRRDLRHLLAR
jgi:hypothetical protein